MKSIFIILFLLALGEIHAQTVDSSEKISVQGDPCSHAVPPNVKENIHRYLKKYGYPDSTVNSVVKIYIQVDIDSTGKASGFKLKRGYDAKFNNAAMEIVRKMPDWTPKICNDIPTKCRMIIPIVFRPE